MLILTYNRTHINEFFYPTLNCNITVTIAVKIIMFTIKLDFFQISSNRYLSISSGFSKKRRVSW